jgi:peptide/nickel transport system permease protein
MVIYILKRMLMFIPTLGVVSLIAFILSLYAPGDPTEMLSAEAEAGSDPVARRKARTELQQKLGLNLPVFYLSLGTMADIDTVYRITDADQRNMLVRLARQSGNPEGTMRYYNDLNHARNLALEFNPAEVNLRSPGYLAQVDRIRELLHKIALSTDAELRTQRADSLQNLLSLTSGMGKVRESWLTAESQYKTLLENPVWWKQWMPSFTWHGTENRYHRWLFGDGKEREGVIRGDFGVSYRNGQPIAHILLPKMKWSLSLALSSLLLAWLISIPLGLQAAYRPASWFDKISGGFVMAFWSVPGFFLGTLLLLAFANPDMLDWFPSGGVKDPSTFDPEWPFWKRIVHYMPYLVLPLAAYTLSGLAFISRQIRAGVQTEMQKDYILTARAKGLSERTVLVRHAFRNALIPLITLMGQYLPALFAGSVLIETIFSIPGMGLEIYESIITNDYPMIVTLFTFFGFLTMLGYLMADIGYALADPRIRFNARKS